MESYICFVCRKRSKWFYESFLRLRTKHTERKILTIIKIILGEASASYSFNSAAICFKCVDRINEYDGMYEKLQIMEHEFKSVICLNMIAKLEDAVDHITPADDVNLITDAIVVDAKEIDVDKSAGDVFVVSSDVPVNTELPEPPQNVQEESIVVEPVADKIPIKTKKTDFYCEECKKSFRNKQGLMVHTFHFHIQTERFECPACRKCYRRKNHLEMHMASNCSTQKNFKCPNCPRKFYRLGSLKLHMKRYGSTSETGPPFICDYCGIEFSDCKTLTDHRQLHLDRPEFQCLECDRVLCKRHVLRLHMSIHSKVTPHLCEICGKAFGRTAALRMHIKRHYSDFNAECYLCKHREMTTTGLQKHMRIHTGEKPYACSKCNKRFSCRNNRESHYQLHFGPTKKPHKCAMCSEAFARPGLLSKHYLKAHGVQMQPTSAAKFIKVNR